MKSIVERLLALPSCEDPDEILDAAQSAAHEIQLLQRRLHLTRQANKRAIELWQKAHPDKALILPDQTDIVAWLIEQHDQFETRMANAHNDWLAELNHDTDELMRQSRLDALDLAILALETETQEVPTSSLLAEVRNLVAAHFIKHLRTLREKDMRSEEIIRADRDAWPDHQADDPVRALKWRDAINAALTNWLSPIEDHETPKDALQRLIRLEVMAALDPAVSKSAADLVAKARRDALIKAAARVSNYAVTAHQHGSLPIDPHECAKQVAWEITASITAMAEKGEGDE
jgi:hypothetical protein